MLVSHLNVLIQNHLWHFDFWLTKNFETSINFITFYKKTIYIHVSIYRLNFIFYEKLDIIDFYIFQCYFMVIFLFNFSNFLQKNYLYRNTDNSTIIIFYIKVEFPTYKLYIYILISYEPYNK